MGARELKGWSILACAVVVVLFADALPNPIQHLAWVALGVTIVLTHEMRYGL